ncbi:MAG: PhzF family phenazine biosynthesis protein [Planctomycetales bacterium]|nr:PhzF family phenazine biosynthesis protein [Planctomycetales bacterium]
MPSTLPLYQIDAFTRRPFHGNPAAVVFCDHPLSPQLMLQIAAENNLSETAFVLDEHDSPSIRWFTPVVEVDLCGHATLAAAHAFFERHAEASEAQFASRSGPLLVRRGVELQLDFPSDPARPAPELQSAVAHALGAPPTELLRGRFDLMAIFDNEATIRSLRPRLADVAALPARGVIVTSQGIDVDFVSRFFAPQAGIDEDPVTGSAHTTLTPYWSRRLGKTRLLAQQVSARGGTLTCEDCGDRTRIAGHAVTYLRGWIDVSSDSDA